MKALLYKEFRLALHPLCYVFVALCPFFLLIPNYPIGVCFIYILSSYPVLFLGSNKGQQSNDLLFSTLLPVRKKDIVLARMITCLMIQFASMALMACMVPVVSLIHQQILLNGGEITDAGFPLEGFVTVLAFTVVGFGLADLIFLPTYYKNGKSIVMSTLFTIFGFAAYILIFTIVIPLIPGAEGYTNFFIGRGLGFQFIFLGASILISAILHFLVYRISAKRLEKVDF